MKYNILCLPDIHWGVIDPYEQKRQLSFIYDFLLEFYKNGHVVDLLVIAGDYFDSKLPLNSTEALFAIQWFHELFELALECRVGKIRMFRGTSDHDNEQLNVFRPLEDRYDPDSIYDPDFFRLFTRTTSEETLEGLHCIYCPDETITTNEYEETYLNEILKGHDIGFFHGSFDVVYGEVLMKKREISEKKNVIFRYDLWDKVIKGPMLAGHWHDGKQYGNLYYIGSPFRWEFNQDEPKGIGFVQYHTETSEYYYQKILNPIAIEYLTYEVYSNLFSSKEDYQRIIEEIQNILDSFGDKPNKLRIIFYILDDKTDNDVFLSSLRQRFVKHKNVKITVKNKLKDKRKREEVKQNQENQEKYQFISDRNLQTSEIIQTFIRNENDFEVPLEFIDSQIKKYIK